MAMLSSHSKPGGKLKIKVLHSWTQHSSYGGGDTLEFILVDVTGDKIHCTYKRIFTPRAKKHMQIGQWCFTENFGLTPATGKYKATSHKYKLSIISSSLVTSSSLKIDDSFLSLTPYESIINGSLDSNFLIVRLQMHLKLPVLPKNELALATGNVEVVKPKGIKRQKDTWCLYPGRSIVDIIMATEIEKCIVKATVLVRQKSDQYYKERIANPNQPLRHV
ncbi:hypothetical protein HID58_074805 [Brassica napus]|uniref:Replication protein A 70 kDa DNA-binding subunit B/D first OB fold domain-containing protein n=1 Tax=Brassica napus TaxID=3708 RepID=A0ABQ7YHV8_BRANA|nr:hypothetical protein HID58_074805 [Brassica napus]